MKSGEPYAVVLAPAAHHLYKKFDPALQDPIKEEVQELDRSPHSAPALHHPFQDLRSHHFHYRKSEYRIAYRVREDKRLIGVVLVKTRERFYEVLTRLIR